MEERESAINKLIIAKEIRKISYRAMFGISLTFTIMFIHSVFPSGIAIFFGVMFAIFFGMLAFQDYQKYQKRVLEIRRENQLEEFDWIDTINNFTENIFNKRWKNEKLTKEC